MTNGRRKNLIRITVAAVLLIVLSATTALAAADYFARYKYAFSPEALVAASAAVPPEQMDESALDIYRLGFAAGFDQALGNNAFADGSGSSPFIAYPIDAPGSQVATRAFVGQPTTPPQTYIANKNRFSQRNRASAVLLRCFFVLLRLKSLYRLAFRAPVTEITK